MKQLFVLVALGFVAATTTKAQQNVGIGTTAPKASAKLDVQSTTQGVTLPSMTSVQRRAIPNPAKGLLVFDMDKACFYFYDGTLWKPIISGNTKDVAPVFFPQPGNITSNDLYGSSLSMSNGFAVVGAYRKDTGTVGSYPGAAYVLKKNTDGSWRQVQVISPSDLTPFASFGFAVSIDSNYMAIAAPYKTEGVLSRAGRVYIYRYNGSTWIEETSIINPAGSQSDSYFGFSVNIHSSPSGVSLAVGSPLLDFSGNLDAGSLSIIRRNASTGLWNAPYVFYGTQANMFLGHAVAIEGNNCIAGAPGFDTTISGVNYSSAGAVNTYFYNGAGWIGNGRLSMQIDTNNYMGYRVAVKDSVVVISGSNSTTVSNGSENIRIYRTNAAGVYTFQQTLNGNAFLPEGTNTCVGYSIAVNKNYLLFSMPYTTIFTNSSCTNFNLDGPAIVYKVGTNGVFRHYTTYALDAVGNKTDYGKSVGLDGTDFGIFGPPDGFSTNRGILFGSLED